MKNLHKDNSREPFTATTDELRKTEEGPARNSRSPLPGGWRLLRTGLRGARLYRMTLPEGGVYWQAEVTLNSNKVHKRFASELHARAWLSLATARGFTLSALDLEDIHGRFRAECLIRG